MSDDFLESDVIEPDTNISTKNRESIGQSTGGLSPVTAVPVAADGETVVVSDDVPLFRGTLDESVVDTLKRDLFEINARLKQVVYPHFPTSVEMAGFESVGSSSGSAEQEDISSASADLWAPLTFIILYSLIVSHAKSLFSSLFVLCWIILLLMGLHLKLARPHKPVSLISYISISGYCLFPQVLQSLLTQILLPMLIKLIFRGNNAWGIRILAISKLLILSICLLWSGKAISLVTKATGIVQIFPLILCLLGLAWLSIIL